MQGLDVSTHGIYLRINMNVDIIKETRSGSEPEGEAVDESSPGVTKLVNKPLELSTHCAPGCTLKRAKHAAFRRLARRAAGQPFYGWYSAANGIRQAASAALLNRNWKGR